MEIPNEISSTDKIVNWLKENIERQGSLSPDIWIEAAFRLNLRLDDEHERLWNLKQLVAGMKVKELEQQEKKNVSLAELKVESSNEYKEMKLQEAKVARVEEFIKIAKAQSRIALG